MKYYLAPKKTKIISCLKCFAPPPSLSPRDTHGIDSCFTRATRNAIMPNAAITVSGTHYGKLHYLRLGWRQITLANCLIFDSFYRTYYLTPKEGSCPNSCSDVSVTKNEKFPKSVFLEHFCPIPGKPLCSQVGLLYNRGQEKLAAIKSHI